jgi:hypothetical protein
MKPSLLEDLNPPSEARGCRVGIIMSQLSETDRKILDDAVKDVGTWSANGLMTALNQRGIRISVHPILRHRKGFCKCYRS